MTTSSATRLPLVTLGMPVFNGERYLPHALQSLLAQDYPNLDILISDNGSTDRTEALCREFVAADRRVRYVKQVENIGAKRNFEFLVTEAQGDYFAWCAHDDVRKPRFVRACVEALERCPSAVLCNGEVAFLDEQGVIREDWGDLNFGTLGMKISERMLRLVDHTDWVDMMGLIRLDALRQVLPFESVWGQDVVLSMKLLGIGDFLKIPEVLFEYRVRSKPRSVEETMEAVTGCGMQPHPYLDMLESLLRAALDALPSKHQKETFFRDFLRTVVGTERQGPHPSWLEAIAKECSPNAWPELAPFFIVRRLLPTLSKDLSVESYLNASVQVVLLGCPNELKSLALIPGIADALKEKYPNARFLVLGSRKALAQVPQLVEGMRFQLPSQWEREAIRCLKQELARNKVDLAIHPGETRNEVALDICLTGSGAFRTVGFNASRPNFPRALIGKALKRYRINDMNKAFTHLLPLCSVDGRVGAIIKALT